jgi:hypothetical protein
MVSLYRQQSRPRDVATSVLVACIGGGFSVLVALITKLTRENRADHGTVHRYLGRIEQKLDDHIEGHNA